MVILVSIIRPLKKIKKTILIEKEICVILKAKKITTRNRKKEDISKKNFKKKRTRITFIFLKINNTRKFQFHFILKKNKSETDFFFYFYFYN